LIQSGEFHYWRLPDKNRWKSMLLQYKQGGLNSIRIYFHWGYHSPAEGVYHFDGNRDVEYLLDLCEELELFVLAAPGPYICAETQAGGHPSWLVAKRDVRLRHAVTHAVRSFDQKYITYGQEWYSQILPILKRHQITVKTKGCILALQIENEAMEELNGYPIHLADDLRIMGKTARTMGMTVPFFTNDSWELGSFIAYPDGHKRFGAHTFGLDLYGFDKYVIFCPTSSPYAAVAGGERFNNSTWGEWDPKVFKNSLDKIEETVRGYGGGASHSPMLIPELQGGWFNHYTVNATYDDVYNYFGDFLTRTIVETALAQGSTALNLYMYYGGTNWGTLGDPDVYTSYDYSACIREYGHLSKRGNTWLI
jgi:hypothetical protein